MSSRVHGGAGSFPSMALHQGPGVFGTSWLFVHYAVLMPGSGIGYHRHDRCEEMFTALDNALRFKHNGNVAELRGPVMVPCREGESHGVYNHTSKPTRFMNFCVTEPGGQYDCTDYGDDLVDAVPGPAERLPAQWIDRKLLTWGPAGHGGRGSLGFRRILGPDDFRTTWAFVDHILIPPACSIGYHRHDGIEECYIILAGEGRLTMDGRTEVVKVGDAALNRLGGSHGIYNHTDELLEVLNVAVALEKGRLDATDQGDDLSKR
ncbi:MAG: cupin domain-containing protein [Candidatus Bathyarchaeia archaeon]